MLQFAGQASCGTQQCDGQDEVQCVLHSSGHSGIGTEQHFGGHVAAQMLLQCCGHAFVLCTVLG